MQIDTIPRQLARHAGLALLAGAIATGAGAQTAAPAAASGPGAAAPMDAAPMLRCRTIGEAAARLACYDAIALPGLGSRSGWGTPVAPAAAAPSGVAPATAADRFGMERHESREMPDRLESRLADTIEGWEPNTRFRLDNGQVWQVVDGSRAYYGKLERPRVVVSRGMLGSFYLQIDGVNQSPRVRRVQ